MNFAGKGWLGSFFNLFPDIAMKEVQNNADKQKDKRQWTCAGCAKLMNKLLSKREKPNKQPPPPPKTQAKKTQ